MPVPQFRWIEYPLDDAAGAALRSVTYAGATTVPLPDLRAWESPLDKARILLESAAEIEHALMVQYLYAVYSLKSSAEVTDSTSSRRWTRTITTPSASNPPGPR